MWPLTSKFSRNREDLTLEHIMHQAEYHEDRVIAANSRVQPHEPLCHTCITCGITLKLRKNREA
jgi:hypothetical protein